MSKFLEDTRTEVVDGRHRVRLCHDWEVIGPFGGYLAAVALRAMGAHSKLAYPVSFTCNFLGIPTFDWVDVDVTTLRSTKRAESLRVVVTQQGRPIVEAGLWAVDRGLPGLEYRNLSVPAAPPPEVLKSYEELTDTSGWVPLWKRISGKPLRWQPEHERRGGSSAWQCWLRLREQSELESPFDQAARAVVLLDAAMWFPIETMQAWPVSHVATSLELHVKFHEGLLDTGAVQQDWLLFDSHSPAAAAGIMTSEARVFTERGGLLASGSSQLLARPVAGEQGR